MSHERKLNPAEQELEKALGQLLPLSANMNRDLLMFQAGATSQRRQRRLWQTSSMVLGLLLCVSLSAIFFQAPSTILSEDRPSLKPLLVSSQPEFQQVPLLTQPPQSLPPNSYLKLRHKVLTDGVEALPEASVSALDEPIITLDNLLTSMSQS